MQIEEQEISLYTFISEEEEDNKELKKNNAKSKN